MKYIKVIITIYRLFELSIISSKEMSLSVGDIFDVLKSVCQTHKNTGK